MARSGPAAAGADVPRRSGHTPSRAVPPGCRALLAAARLSELKVDFLGCDWQLGDTHPHRIVDGIADGRRQREERELGDRFCAVRTVPLARCDEHILGRRNIAYSRHFVVM